jgi:ribosome biogenesis GTPase A
MASARKKAAETLAIVDVVIEVLDARIPGASSNPMIEELRLHRQRPSLKVLNKADLADPAVTAAWLKVLGAQPGVKAIAISCKRPQDVTKVPAQAASLVPHRGGPEKPVRAMIMGIPNVGKSTLINALLKRKVAKVGDEPAITKHQSRHQLHSGFDLIDTPGLMWPKIEHDADGLMLAASHAIGENAFVDEEVAAFLAITLMTRYAPLVEARYRCDTRNLDGPGLIETIAKKRGYIVKGGGMDYLKAARTLLQDYRDGALGRISLETPESRQRMLDASRGMPSVGESARLAD